LDFKTIQALEISMSEQLGKHKGAVETLLHEKKELSRLLQIVNSQLEKHLSALEEQGIDTEQFIQNIQQESQQAPQQQQQQTQQRQPQGRQSSQNNQRQGRKAQGSNQNKMNSRKKTAQNQQNSKGRRKKEKGKNQKHSKSRNKQEDEKDVEEYFEDEEEERDFNPL